MWGWWSCLFLLELVRLPYFQQLASLVTAEYHYPIPDLSQLPYIRGKEKNLQYSR
jgi:hypothetical protein